MPIEPLDILLLVVMLVSALLAMVRGFMREIFSIISWAAAAVVTLYFYKRLVPIAKQYIYNDLIATGAVVGILFLGTLLVVSIITIKISDAILDSRVGALDRTLGFLFGLARGPGTRNSCVTRLRYHARAPWCADIWSAQVS